MEPVVEKRIYTSDDLVPDALRESLHDMVKRPIWAYGWHSNGVRDRYAFWHAHGAGGGFNTRVNCTPELSENKTFAPVLDLWGHLSLGPLRSHFPLRAYANAHTYGTEGYTHADSGDRDNDWSTVYFAHRRWDPNWGGELVFFDQSDEIIQAIYPRPGRLVIFPGEFRHCARGVTRECPDLRVSIVFKSHHESRSHDEPDSVSPPPPSR
jgi:SM-20-related protein